MKLKLGANFNAEIDGNADTTPAKQAGIKLSILEA